MSWLQIASFSIFGSDDEAVETECSRPVVNGGPTSSSGNLLARARKIIQAPNPPIATSPIPKSQTPSPRQHTLEMSLEGPPPSRNVSSTPISLEDASRMLDTYITNSERHPHLHPDAQITPLGVQFSSHSGPNGGVLLHNLRRVAAGLKGEFLEPEKTPEPDENEDGAFGAKKYNNNGQKRKDFSTITDDDWQDKAEYDAEQGGIEVGEIGDRSNVVEDGGVEPEVQSTGGPGEEVGKKRKVAGEEFMDKAARKQAKKERDQQRKRENEKKRQAEKA